MLGRFISPLVHHAVKIHSLYPFPKSIFGCQPILNSQPRDEPNTGASNVLNQFMIFPEVALGAYTRSVLYTLLVENLSPLTIFAHLPRWSTMSLCMMIFLKLQEAWIDTLTLCTLFDFITQRLCFFLARFHKCLSIAAFSACTYLLGSDLFSHRAKPFGSTQPLLSWINPFSLSRWRNDTHPQPSW